MDPVTKYLHKIAYKFPKGYPDMDNPEDKVMLMSLVEQEIEIDKSIVPNDQDGEKQDKVADVIKNYSSEDIIGLFQSLELDQEQLNKLFNRVNNFKSYRPIKKEITDSGWNPKIIKKFSREIQELIEDLGIEDKKKFINYLNSKKIDFPSNSTGNLIKTLAATGVPTNVVQKIIKHTSQDEGTRGVGMGEVGLTLLFDNIGASGGKGDLAIDGQEFEIKGNGATLGEKPFKLINVINDKLDKYGINYKSGQRGMNRLPYDIVDAYNKTDDKESLKAVFKDILINDNKLGSNAVNARFNNIDFTDPESFNTEIGLMNFIRYAEKEGFTHFLAHDYGKGGPNNGQYIYVSGSPERMANELKDSGIKFEKITPNILRPRMGFSNTMKEE